MSEDRGGIIRRIRRAVFGDSAEPGLTSITMAISRTPGSGYLAPDPGPFDEPPAEPVRLDPDSVPWELRDE